MPELPDIELYLHALRPRIEGRRLSAARMASPFLLRSVEPPLARLEGLRVQALSRLGKRIVVTFDRSLHLVLHLMIAGRLQWQDGPPAAVRRPRRGALGWLDFDHGRLLITEAGSKKRASLYLVAGDDGLAALDPGGIEPLDCSLAQLRRLLAAAPHTIKRTLSDPRLVAGIGNAYSDEILHAARLSPFKRSPDLDREETERLWSSMRDVLCRFRDLLIERHGERFPKKVTAFLPEMAVHGKFGQPCPTCGSAVQRIVYSTNEANYCAGCQTGGRLLSDRALARLLREDWPKTLEELEERRDQRGLDQATETG